MNPRVTNRHHLEIMSKVRASARRSAHSHVPDDAIGTESDALVQIQRRPQSFKLRYKFDMVFTWTVQIAVSEHLFDSFLS